jgi:hypothetical protein
MIMDDKEFWQLFGLMQSRTLAHTFILTEMLADIARSQPDPHGYLANVLDRVSTTLDKKPVAEQVLSDANIRDAVQRLISAADTRLRP